MAKEEKKDEVFDGKKKSEVKPITWERQHRRAPKK